MNKNPHKKAHSGAPQKDRTVWFQQKASFPMRDAAPVALETFWTSRLVADVAPGHHWECLGPDNVAGRVTALTMHPHNPKQWFAGCAAGGVWVSNDAGESWSTCWSPFANQNIGSLAWLENDQLAGGPLFLFAGTGEANMHGDAYPGSGIYQSSDLGWTWQPTFGPACGTQGSIDWDVRTFPRRVGSMAFRKFKMAIGSISLDNSLPAGLYLADVNTGKGFSAVEYWGRRSYNCHSVLMHPSDEKILYASIEPDGYHNGLWRSSDFGKTWTHLTKGLPHGDMFKRASLAFAPSDPDVMYALAADARTHVLGVFRSTNGGNGWREILGGHYPHERQMHYNNVIAVHPRKPDQVIWGGMHLHRTDDAGRHWRTITNNENRSKRDYCHADHHALLWPEDDLVISGNDGGVAVSNDGGRNWKNKSQGMITAMFYGVDVSPTNAKIFGGGTQDNGILIGGVEREAGPLSKGMVPAVSGDGGYIAFNAANENDVYACVTQFMVYHHRPGKPWDSSGWKQVMPRHISEAETEQRAFTVMAIDPSKRSGTKTVWAGSTRLWQTDNCGQTWKPVSLSFDDTPISAMAVSHGRSRTIYVGTTAGGIFRSHDGGRLWSQSLSSIDIPNRGITDIQFHPTIAGTIVMTVASSGIRSSGVDLETGNDLPYGHVFRSEDFGETWTDIDRGKLPNVVFYAAAFQTKPPYRLFVAGDAGVWVETKDGWLNVSGNLPSAVVSDLVYHDKEGTLTAATYGRGIWRLTPGDLDQAAPAVVQQEQITVAPGLRVDPRTSAPQQLTPADDAVNDDPYKRTRITVQPVPNALAYQVELGVVGEDNTSMAFSSATPEITIVASISGKARWRVWALFGEGLRSPASGWRNITYTTTGVGST